MRGSPGRPSSDQVRYHSGAESEQRQAFFWQCPYHWTALLTELVLFKESGLEAAKVPKEQTRGCRLLDFIMTKFGCTAEAY